MAYQLFTGLLAEGKTDGRFLSILVKRCMEELTEQDDCALVDEIYEVQLLEKPKDLGFADQVAGAIEQCRDRGIMLLFLHSDSDARSADSVFSQKMQPAQTLAAGQDKPLLVPVVPVQETEAWLLADWGALSSLFPKGVLSDLPKPAHIEQRANPKELIQAWVGKAQAHRSKRHRLGIEHIYDLLAADCSLPALRHLPAFRRFEADLAGAFRAIGLLRP